MSLRDKRISAEDLAPGQKIVLSGHQFMISEVRWDGMFVQADYYDTFQQKTRTFFFRLSTELILA